jgi:hypothetical protein
MRASPRRRRRHSNPLRAFLDLTKVAEQIALELVEVARLLTGPEVADEPGDATEAGPQGWATHDR